MDKTELPIIALVGPPNAGKSTLLNKIAGRQMAVTSDLPGTTRDRQYVDTAWNGNNFTLVDTAGLTLKPADELETNVKKQIDIAVQEADVLILVVDGKQPVNALDAGTLKKFRRLKKPILLAVNKVDSPNRRDAALAEFSKLGVKKSFAVSAISGRGIGDMLDAISEVVPDVEARRGVPSLNLDGMPGHAATTTDIIAVSIVGKPNVGKSSIFNKILKDERAVVSALPGTTRTAVDSDVTIDGVNYTFIDTAGLKKKEYRQAQADIFSGFQAFKSIRRSDVCLFVVDAAQEITKQDQRVAAEIFAMQKGCIILANKCDLLSNVGNGLKPFPTNAKSLEKNRDNQYQNVRDYISHHFPFLWMCPLFFVSAVIGEGLDEGIAAIKPIFDRRQKTIDNQTMSEFLNKMLKKNPPKLLRDQKKPKVFSLHQRGINPPAFELFVNHPAAISQQFRKFIENSIIRDLNFWGTPIVLRLKGKDKA